MKPYEYLDLLPLTLDERQRLMRAGYAYADQLLRKIRLEGDAYVTLLGRDNRLEVIPVLRSLLPVQVPPVPASRSSGWWQEALEGCSQGLVALLFMIFCLWFVGRSCSVVHY